MPAATARRQTSARRELAAGDASTLRSQANGILSRHPAVGLALGVVRNGGLDQFYGHGYANVESRMPVTEDTVFRIASITKTFTAIAVMQLVERGLVELDAPANDYLRAYRLEPVRPSFRPATVRHLLTHTAGIREVLHLAGLLRLGDLGETVRAGRPVPSLAEYYRGALRIDANPGTAFAYTNHGFATLGQIVEDVSRRPLEAYFREHIFDPLGMTRSSLGRSERTWPHAATGYELRAAGIKAVPDYDVITVGGGAVYSTPADMARYMAALLNGAANDHGSVLEPGTLAQMFEPHFQPDPRLPGFGLGFFRAGLGGHVALEHDGILPGFDSQIFLAPQDGVGVIAFANGARGGMHWLTPEIASVLRQLIGVPADVICTDIPHHPELWGELCGRYGYHAHWADPGKLALGAGVDVFVRRGRLLIRARSVIPALRKGFLLHPDDPTDPYVFRIELPWFGIGSCRVVFSRAPGAGTSAVHLDLGAMSFQRKPAEQGLHLRRFLP